MATIVPTFTKIRGRSGGVDAMLVKWAAMGNADTGQAVQLTFFADKSIQFDGTWGGATAVLEGSNLDDGTGGVGTYITLNDPSATALSFTSNGQKAVTEVTAWVRPRTSGGSGSSITAALLLRRPFR